MYAPRITWHHARAIEETKFAANSPPVLRLEMLATSEDYCTFSRETGEEHCSRR